MTEPGTVAEELGGDGVLHLTLDRPGRRNALDDHMLAALVASLEHAEVDERVRAVLLTGAGDDFCSGFDLAGRQGRGEERPRTGSIQRRMATTSNRLIEVVLSVQVPIVCAARGWVSGLGLHLAVASDVCVVSDTARLWEPFARRGFTPDSGGTWLLPRRVGEVRARELLLLGRQLSGTEAADWALVHQAVPDVDLDETAGRLAADLAAGPTVALGLTKLLLHQSGAGTVAEHLRREAAALELSSRSPDFREGMAAFAAKRAPEFGGR